MVYDEPDDAGSSADRLGSGDVVAGARASWHVDPVHPFRRVAVRAGVYVFPHQRRFDVARPSARSDGWFRAGVYVYPHQRRSDVDRQEARRSNVGVWLLLVPGCLAGFLAFVGCMCLGVEQLCIARAAALSVCPESVRMYTTKTAFASTLGEGSSPGPVGGGGEAGSIVEPSCLRRQLDAKGGQSCERTRLMELRRDKAASHALFMNATERSRPAR